MIEMRALGVTSEDMEAHLARHGYGKEPEYFDIWEEHVAAVETYQRCQFNVAVLADGRLAYLGISAGEIESVTRALRFDFNGDLLDEVQTIANAAAAVMNERKQ